MVGDILPPKAWGLGTMKTAPKPPIHLCYASVEIRTPRACSTIAAPVYAVPTTLVKLKAESRSSSTSTGVPAGRITPLGAARGTGVPSAYPIAPAENIAPSRFAPFCGQKEDLWI